MYIYEHSNVKRSRRRNCPVFALRNTWSVCNIIRTVCLDRPQTRIYFHGNGEHRPGRSGRGRSEVFIGAVLAFCAGIYLQAVHALPLGPLLLAGAASIGSIALIYRLLHRAFFLLVPLILVCSLLLGAARLAFVEIGPAASLVDGQSSVFEGLVTESSSHVKVLSLQQPVELKGMKVAFISDAQIDTSQRVRLFGKMIDLVPTFQNPGGGSWKWQKRLEGVTYQIRGKLLSVGSGDDPVARLRRYFKENIEHSGAGHIEVLKALTIGDRTAVSRGIDDLFMRTGTTHVLIVSGFKVSVISGFFFILVRMILGRVRVWRLSGRHSRYAALLTIPFPIMFMLVSGAGIPVIRATIMIVTFLIATFLERERHFYHTMALATLIILLLYPHSLMTASFQLTFCGVLSIVIFMKRLFPLLIRFKNRFLAWSISTVLSTASVTVGTRASRHLLFLWHKPPFRRPQSQYHTPSDGGRNRLEPDRHGKSFRPLPA